MGSGSDMGSPGLPRKLSLVGHGSNGSGCIMERLPVDQVSLPIASLHPVASATSALKERRQSKTGCSRPNSAASSKGGLVRLPDAVPSATAQQPDRRREHSADRSEAPGNGEKCEAPPPRVSVRHADAELTLPVESLTTQSAMSSAPGSRSAGVRGRMSKPLTIATVKVEPAKKKPQVFRMLKDGETIEDLYDFADEIYNGGAKGRVLIAKRKSDGGEVVVKVREKHASRGGERAWKTIMSQVYKVGGSQHLLDIIEIVESPTSFFVIMPRCHGGELFEFLVTETEVPEVECKRITREILIAAGHLHKNNLVHRDIKPENVLFHLEENLEGPSPKTVKLIDYDTCIEWTPQTPKSRRFVGTPGYIAPEALKGEISPQSDLWSIGVILYILMTGVMPWSSLVSLEDGVVGSAGAQEMYEALRNEKLHWDQEPWPDFPVARDLCQRLLKFDLEERMQTVEDCLNHDWLREG